MAVQDAGDLMDQVSLQTPTEVSVEGEITRTWNDIASDPEIWVNLDWKRGSRIVRMERLEARSAAVMTGYWRDDLDVDMQALWGTTVLRFLEKPQRVDNPFSLFFEVLVAETDADD